MTSAEENSFLLKVTSALQIPELIIVFGKGAASVGGLLSLLRVPDSRIGFRFWKRVCVF